MNSRAAIGVSVATAAVAACQATFIDVGSNATGTGGSGTGGSPASSSSNSSSTTGGTGGATFCKPGATASCYDGPAGTEGVGICKSGLMTCTLDGASWGPCVGEVLRQPPDCASGKDLHCDGQVPSCKGSVIWSVGVDDPNAKGATGLAVDALGCAVTGYFYGSVGFAGGPTLTSSGGSYAFLARLDTNGMHLWSKGFGDSGGQGVASGSAVATDASGNVVATGIFSGTVGFGGAPLTSTGIADIFIAKFAANGAPVWSKSFGTTGSQVANGIAVDASGDIILAGSFTGAVNFGGATLNSAGGQDIFVAKLDPSGNHIWSARFGDVAPQSANGVAVDGAGNVALTGYFGGAVNFGGATLSSAGGLDGFVAKLGADGSHIWSARFGDTSDDAGQSVAVDASGNVLLAGHFGGSVSFGGPKVTSANARDAFLVKLGSSGAHAWSMGFGVAAPAAYSSADSVTVDPAGNVTLTGSFAGSVDFGGGPLASAGGLDMLLAKFDTTGAHVWSKRFGDLKDQAGMAVAANADGSVVTVGDYHGSIYFGGGKTLVSAVDQDLFVAKFSP